MKKSRKKRRIIEHSRRVKKSTKKAVRKRRKQPRKKQIRKPIKKKTRKIKKIKKTKKPVKKFGKKTKKIRRKPIRRKTAKRVKKHRRRIVRRRVKKLTRRAKKRFVKKVISRKSRSINSSLDRLFESPAKVQVMKLFFRNPETKLLLKEAARSMRMNLSAARKQMKKLEKIGFLKTRQISSRKQTFFINPNFDFFNELKALILKSIPVSREKILKAVRGVGKIKLVLLSGLLVENNLAPAGSRADLLIVGDSINARKLNTLIKNLEAEAGTDIRCVAMTTEEFNYRYDMYDRFVRDLLGEKGEFLINKLEL